MQDKDSKVTKIAPVLIVGGWCVVCRRIGRKVARVGEIVIRLLPVVSVIPEIMCFPYICTSIVKSGMVLTFYSLMQEYI